MPLEGSVVECVTDDFDGISRWAEEGRITQKILWSYSNHYFLRGPLQGFILDKVFFICPPDLIQIFLCPYSLPREDNLYGFYQQAPVPSSFELGLVTIGEREETEIKDFIPDIPPLLSAWVIDVFWQPVTGSFKAVFITPASLLGPGNLFLLPSIKSRGGDFSAAASPKFLHYSWSLPILHLYK